MENFGPLNSLSLVTIIYMQRDYPVEAQSGASRETRYSYINYTFLDQDYRFLTLFVVDCT
jgi:hypothetical protein